MPPQTDWRDRAIAVIDQGLRTLTAPARPSRPSPAGDITESGLSTEERRRSANLMRVNHAGEISAQALYRGQALFARSDTTRQHLIDAAREERDHLGWCAQRLTELEGRSSLLGPLWYAGSFCIGAAAGAVGDAVSLGFVTETERQVESHIKDHLERLPAADAKSRKILMTMAADEAHHGTMAQLAGGARLPWGIRRAMAFGGGFLRRVAYLL